MFKILKELHLPEIGVQFANSKPVFFSDAKTSEFVV